ncbi:MAG: hypothetical protein JSS90_10680 [Bacteroidetes bacterium]|nr:hypothetical protein [Bacteroidota bacterium]
MIIRLFKSAQTPPLFLVPLLSLIIVFMSFRINDLHLIKDVSHGPLYLLLTEIPVLQVRWVILSLVFFLVTTQIYFFNYVVNRYEVLFKKSNIPAIVFFLLYACIPDFLIFSPFLIINSFLTILLYSLFGIYKSESPLAHAFDTGFVLAMMILFYTPAVILVPFLFISIAILRPFSSREWISTLIGIAVPFVLMITVLTVMDKLQFLKAGYHDHEWIPVLKLNMLETKYLITALAITFMIVLSMLKLSKNYFKNIIRTRKFQLCFMLLLLFVFVIVMLPIQHTPARYSLLITPVALFLSYYFLTIKKMWWFELLTILLLSIIALNYMSLS